MELFVNRTKELAQLSAAEGGLTLVFGRRRIGKTTLIEKWGRDKPLYYSQAIEAAEPIQVTQIAADFADILPRGIVPRSWQELFGAFSLLQGQHILVLDEFPYLVKSQPSLPSMLQRWVDHDQPEQVGLVLLGSSQTMMHGTFLSAASPLFERAGLILHLEPMAYPYFCEALGVDPLDEDNFTKYALVGGVPKYWDYITATDSIEETAWKLFFQKSSRLEAEPDRLLKDEGIAGEQAKSIFECIGRGAKRPSEIASRIGVKQTALSKPLRILMHASLVKRCVPFGENASTSKRNLYVIADFALRFWYSVYSPHRSRWHLYKSTTRLSRIREHCASVLENCFRSLYQNAAPYWQGKECEFDCVRYNPDDLESVIVSEIKHRRLQNAERKKIQATIRDRFHTSKLAAQYRLAEVEVLDTEDVLRRLAADMVHNSAE